VTVVLAAVLVAAVTLSFSSRIELVAVAAVAACGVAWIADRNALRRVLRVGLVVAALFAAAVATAAVAWASGLDRGLDVGAVVLLRLVVLGVAAALVARSADAESILSVASRLGMQRLGLVFGLALNALPHLSETASTVWSAHRVRSGGRWASLRRLPALAEVLMAHTGRVADQSAAAAALRGHTALGRPPAPLTTAARTVIVTGPTSSGKSPLMASVADELMGRGIEVAGFVQPAVVEAGRKIGFGIRDLATGDSVELARRVATGAGDFGTSFSFSDSGFELGERALRRATSGSILMIDELGPLELRGGGHWPAAARAVAIPGIAGLVVVVRRSLVPALVEALDAGDVVVVDLEAHDGDPVAAVVSALVNDLPPRG
jgi:nucleoside-triphosphatase THEP1